MTTLEGPALGARFPRDARAATPQRVLVVVDGPATRDALRWAAGRAIAGSVDAGVLAAVPAQASPATAMATRRAADDAARRLTAALPSTRIVPRIVVGDPCDAIVAASIDSDLLVIGVDAAAPTRGTTRLALLARCTTVLVPAGLQPVGGHVVVRVAGIAGDAAAIAFAAEEAGRLRRPLTLVHTWAPTGAPRASVAADRAIAARYRSILEHRSVRDVRRRHPGLVVEERIGGPSPHALTTVGAGAALVVAAAPAGRGIEHEFDRGAVADLVERPPCPVVLVRDVRAAS